MAELREEELRQQIAALKAANRPESTRKEDNSSQSFWGQPFLEEIDEAVVPANFRELLIESFDGTQYPMPICKLSTHRCTSVEAATDSAATRLFLSQFAANKAKKLEVANLFHIKQASGESLKSFLARFNTATVRVNDPDQKFFVKAFQKGLRAGPFSDALALRRPANMEEIRARAEKHIEVEEDQAERMEADNMHLKGKQVEENPKQNHTRVKQTKHHFTPLTERRA
ncbi:hypothetical protein CR513_42449, partial [Mucuna pruriens]